MRNGLLIGIGAGFAATLCFLSGAGGSRLVAILLSILTPLPVLLAGLGWGYLSAVIAVLVATGSIAALAGQTPALVFILLFGILLPLLCRLALLSRDFEFQPEAAGTPARHTEWYPLGRLLLVATGFVGTIGVGALLVVSPDPEAHRTALKAMLLQMLELNRGIGKGPSEAEIDQLARLYAPMIPAIWAANWVVSVSLNLWLAGMILHYSGRLPRPWPLVSAIAYPFVLPLLFVAALFACALEHPLGTIAIGLSGALFAAFTLLGLAVLHWLTVGVGARPLLLTIAYLLAILLFPLGTAMIAMLGLSDPILKLRRGRPPPPRPPTFPINQT